MEIEGIQSYLCRTYNFCVSGKKQKNQTIIKKLINYLSCFCSVHFTVTLSYLCAKAEIEGGGSNAMT